MASRVVNVHAAKTHLSRLLEEVEGGEQIIVARAGRPIARLIPYTEARETRVPGIWRGQVSIAPDFDVSSDELIAAFEG